MVALYGLGAAIRIAGYKVLVGPFFGGHGSPGTWIWCTPLWALPLAVVVVLLGLALAVLLYPRGHTRRRKQPLSGLTY